MLEAKGRATPIRGVATPDSPFRAELALGIGLRRVGRRSLIYLFSELVGECEAVEWVRALRACRAGWTS